MADTADREFLTPADIARRLKRSRATVYREILVPSSGLVYHRIGRNYVVGVDAFEFWLNGEASGNGRDVRGLRQAR